MRVQRLPLILTVEEYKRLEAIATAHERDPWQQARWMLRRALQDDISSVETAHQSDREVVR